MSLIALPEKTARTHTTVRETVVALIPAHDEASGIAATIASLRRQSRAVDRILVIADNCTDDTVNLALAAGAEVLETSGNTAKKAGALNQGLTRLRHEQDRRRKHHSFTGDDQRRSERRIASPTEFFILAMDADGQLAPNFIETALQIFGERPNLGGLSGAVTGRTTNNWLETAQAVEYARGSRNVGRRQGRVWVLAGAATMFRASMLHEVAEQRGDKVPGEPSIHFLEDSLTEDYELTLALRKLGYDCLSSKRCQVVTDLMPTIGALYTQRIRWTRGTLETLAQYGFNAVTRRHWLVLAAGYLYSLMLPMLLTLLALSYMLYDTITFDARWLVFWPLVLLEQYINARRANVRFRSMGRFFFLLWIYDQLIFIFRWMALLKLLRRTSRTWIT
jgi:poly-beta-1,6-N-acetyl-D-glucosamine synthase